MRWGLSKLKLQLARSCVDVLVSVISAVNPPHQRSPLMEVCKLFVDAMVLDRGDDVISALKSN